MVTLPRSKPASERVPIIARHAVSDRAKKTLDLVSRMRGVAREL